MTDVDFDDADTLEELERMRAQATKAVRRNAEKQLAEIKRTFGKRRDAIRRENGAAREIIVDVETPGDGGGSR
jgi:hypothetical protein